jgi:cation diffusion facilitator CzcD-associated flavoprotein CzcO
VNGDGERAVSGGRRRRRRFGLFMAETLKRARIDFTVYEKAGGVGGTWRDNTFPGLFVDVLSRQYEFPFQPNYGRSRKYAPATEIQAYVEKVARDRRLL